MDIQFDASSVRKWIDNSSDRQKAKKIVLKKIGIKAEQKIRDQSQKISASGQLEQSIQHRVLDESTVGIFAKGYADIALEYGRKPGKMPPISALENWAARKLGDPKLAYPIAKKIAKSGTRKYRRRGPRQLTRAFRNTQKYVEKDLEEYLEKMTI